MTAAVTGGKIRPDWPSYLERFHAERPGITEMLLGRCRDHAGQDPYEWLARSVAGSGPVLDLACGSGPMKRLVDTAWVGVDRSGEELGRAVANDAQPVLNADAAALPLPDSSVETVVCSMALMLFSPLTGALEEIHRVLVPGGTLQLTVPARRPLSRSDTWRYLRLYLALGSPARFPPSPLRRRPTRVIAESGFSIVSSERRRFGYPLNDHDAARRFVDALYLPGVSSQRLEHATEVAHRWEGSEIGIALHRVVAERRP